MSRKSCFLNFDSNLNNIDAVDMKELLENYHPDPNFFDELANQEGDANHYNAFLETIAPLTSEDFVRLNENARLSFLNNGITYALYNEKESVEQVFPFDLFPRIINDTDWQKIEQGVLQRNRALNLFIKDVYNEGKIFKDNIIPEALIKTSVHYCPLMENFIPKKDIYCHISGTDIIRHSDSNYYILEDNLRSPSGVSYVLSNRIAMQRTIPDSFDTTTVEGVNDYADELLKMLWSVSGRELGDIFCVLLTPGSYNSAYYEHTYLAQKMGIELVEGRDLYVEDNFVYLKTIGGNIRVDVIYRRIDDQFLDPEVFRKDSMLGVYGLIQAYLHGNVTIVNAPGTGISDDKAVCAYVPDMIRYYLGEDAIISNVPTYICEKEKDLQYTLDHIEKLVVKPVDMSGGYGVRICDQLTTTEISELKEEIKANPRNYIAQPKMLLSTHPTYIEENGMIEPRHIDLRTFTILGGAEPYVLKGGLTRTALTRGSLIVNSSQGGGSKDTWVLNTKVC